MKISNNSHEWPLIKAWLEYEAKAQKQGNSMQELGPYSSNYPSTVCVFLDHLLKPALVQYLAVDKD
jgi:hypothetical protein